jgi:hypothetical protein
MNERTLRTEAAKHNHTVTDEGWAILVACEYVDGALGKDFDEDKVAEIIRAIDHVGAQFGTPAKSGGRSSESAEGAPGSQDGIRPGPFAVDLTDTERERALLFIEAQVKAAAGDQRVKEFRNHHCSGGLLSAEKAEKFLNSSDAPRLEAVASHLQRLHGWNKGESAWWVLTGEAPDCRPVKVSYRVAESEHSLDLYLITIEAPPWISPTTFRGAFAEMRRRMHAERKPPDARSVRVVRFVESLRNDVATEKLSFREMWRRWNENHPEETFSESRTFETAYRRTSKVLQRQYNTEIERRETPELRRQRARLKREGEGTAKSRSS